VNVIDAKNKSEKFDVAVIGGGAAGCLLAIALGEAGLSVALLERNDRLPFNGGEFIKPNGLLALRHYGLEDAVAAPTSRRRLINYYHDGKALFTYDYAEHTTVGYYAIVPHAKTIAAMIGRLEKLENVKLGLGVGNAKLCWNSDRVTHVELAGGGSIQAAVIVGADGVHSSVRASMGILDQPRIIGNDVYMASFPSVPSVTQLNRLYLSKTGWLVYFYPLNETQFRMSVAIPSEQAKEVFAGGAKDFVARIRPFVTQSDDALEAIHSLSGLVRLSTFDYHVPTYTRGNVALIGDAAHSGHPVTGQGMNLAFSDAISLANALAGWAKGETALSNALAHYETDRRSINERVLCYGRDLLGAFPDRSRYVATFDHALHGGAPRTSPPRPLSNSASLRGEGGPEMQEALFPLST
jgi:HQNO biosynthesis monooxygenase PqsL